MKVKVIVDRATAIQQGLKESGEKEIEIDLAPLTQDQKDTLASLPEPISVAAYTKEAVLEKVDKIVKARNEDPRQRP